MQPLRLFSIAVLFAMPGKPVFSQQWMDMMHDQDANFYDIRKEFEKYWADKQEVLDRMRLATQGKANFTEEDKSTVAGWKQFKRWEWFMEPRVYPTGERFDPDAAWKEYQKQQNQKSETSSVTGNWAYFGPNVVPNGGGGAGRVNCIRFDPANSNTVYAGSPAGGLWKSTNGGVGWTMWNTDNLTAIGVSDIAIDPTNSQIMYLGTGDADGTDTYALGVLKSTDGGLTWNTTGLNWTITQARTVRRLQIDPTNTQIIHAGTSNGIYRTINGGTDWTRVFSSSVRDMELKPDDPTTIYAVVGNTVYRSTNSGQSYVSIYAVPGAGRLALAVTPADPNYVYVLATNGSSFLGFYRSTNGGSSFLQMSNSPNILGYSSSGSSGGGQGGYDLAAAASPTNADEVVVGGINIWRSTNGGSEWTIVAHWYGGGGAPYVHADVHDLIYLPGSGTTIYAGCDGGVFRTQNNGSFWNDLSAGLDIAQMYRLGLSTSNSSLTISGWQDNGTTRYNGNNWTYVIGGDGMECFIDRTNNNMMFGELYNGDFQRSQNGGSSWSSIQSGLSGSAAWVTPWLQDPADAGTLWAGYTEVFKSTNRGNTWTQSGTMGGSGTIRAIDVSPSNNQIIYAARRTSIWKSTDGGSSWTNISSGLPIGSSSITYIEIDPEDENHLWVTFSGYSSTNKVFVTINGGSAWSNYSTGLPGVPVNCIVYENGSSNGVYVGTDIGVYYRDSSLTSWVAYNTGLPNLIVSELEIQYTAGKLRAATYGRGMWQSDLYSTIGVAEADKCLEDCIRILPNPNSGSFEIVLDQLNGNYYKVELSNSLGQRIYSEDVKAISGTYRKQFDLTTFGKGIYLVCIFDGVNNMQRRVVVL